MGNIVISKRTLDRYFSLLSRWNNDSKKKLIVRLTESIESKETQAFDVSSLFGAWDDSRDSDEIIRQIKDSRVNKQGTKGFA